FEDGELVVQLGAESQRASVGHGVNGVEHQVFDDAAQQHRIATDRRQIAKVEFGFNPGRAVGQLSLKELDHVADHLVEIDGLDLRRRHLGEVAKAADDGLQIGNLGEQRGCTLAKYLVELLGSVGAGAQQILDGDLQRKQRVLELVSQAAGQF